MIYLPRMRESRASLDEIVREMSGFDLLGDVKQRLAALEADNATLRARADRLEHFQGRKIIPAPVEPRTRVRTPPAIVALPIDLPNESELRALREICRASGYEVWTNCAF